MWKYCEASVKPYSSDKSTHDALFGRIAQLFPVRLSSGGQPADNDETGVFDKNSVVGPTYGRSRDRLRGPGRISVSKDVRITEELAVE